MKKLILRVLTVMLMVCFGAFLMTACGDTEKPEEPVTYTLTYKAGEGTGSDVTEQHEEGATVTLKGATTFTYAAHTFTAWSDGETEYEAGATFTMPKKNVTLTAQWAHEPDEGMNYTVTYDLNGGEGTTPTETTKEEGDTFTLAAAPSRTGYTFKGWSDGENTYAAGATYTMPAKNVTLTAQWEAVGTPPVEDEPLEIEGEWTGEVEVAMESGGEPGIALLAETYTVTMKFTLSVVAIENDDYVAIALMLVTMEDEYGVMEATLYGYVSHEDVVYTLEIAELGDPTFTYADGKISITFDAEGAPEEPVELSAAPAAELPDLAGKSYYGRTSVYEPYNTISIDADGNPVLENVEEYTVLWIGRFVVLSYEEFFGTVDYFYEVTEDALVEHSFSSPFIYTEGTAPTTYLVQFDYDWWYVEEGKTLQSYIDAELAWEFPTAWADYGYTFDGWYDGDTKITPESTFSQDTVLEARFSPIEPTVTFDGDGAEGTDPTLALTWNAEDGVYEGTLPENPYTAPAGKVFGAWAVAVNGGDAGYFEEGDEIILAPGCTAIITAVWDEAGATYYTVTIDRNNGSDPETQRVKEGDSITLDTPSRNGWTFDGWYVDETRIEGDYTVTDNVTITAKWTAKTPVVSYEGLSEGDSETYHSVGELGFDGYYYYYHITITGEPEKDGYTFMGWEVYVNGYDFTWGEYLFTEDTIPVDLDDEMSVVLTAIWEKTPEQYNVSYNLGEGVKGEAPETQTVLEGTSFNLPAEPVRANYTFKGWNDGENTYGAGEEYTMPGGDVTFTAVWEFAIASPDFTFDANDGEGTAPALTAGEDEFGGKYFTVRLPENPYTAPANKYFRGWEIGEVVFFPGEYYDVLPGAQISVKAVWEDLLPAIEREVTSQVRSWGAEGLTVTTTLAEGKTVSFEGTATDAAPVNWHSFLAEIPLTINDTFYLLHLRVDDYIFTFTKGDGETENRDSNNTDELKGVISSTWNEDTYKAAYANGAVLTHILTASLANNVLTFTYSAYAESDVDRSSPITTSTWELTSSVDISSVSVAYYYDGLTMQSAKLYGYNVISENQWPTESDPIVMEMVNFNANMWSTEIRKGETLTLDGSIQFTGAALDNWDGLLASLYTASAVGIMRLDHWLLDNSYAYNEPPAPIFDLARERLHYVTEIKLLNDYLQKGGTYAITAVFDWSEADRIVYTTKIGDNYSCTWTITAMEGSELEDNYYLNLGVEDSKVTFTSLARTSEKLHTERRQLSAGGEAQAKEDPDTWYIWNEGATSVTKNVYIPAYDSFTFAYTSTDTRWYGVQIFYLNSELKNGTWYRLVLDIKADVACIITINGSEVDLEKGNNHVEVYFEHNGISFSLQMGVAATDSFVSENEITISEWKWEEANRPGEQIEAPTAFSVSDEGVISVTASENNGEKGRAWYEIGFFKAGSVNPEITLRVKDGDTLVYPKLAAGTYTVKVRQLAVSGYNTSDWSEAGFQYVAEHEALEEYDLSAVTGGSDNAIKAGDWVYYCWSSSGSASVTSATYSNGTVTISYTGHYDQIWNIQLYWRDVNLAQGDKYDLSFTVESSVAGYITVFETPVAVNANEGKVYSVENLTQGEFSTIALQMGGFINNAPMPLAADGSATVIISNITVNKQESGNQGGGNEGGNTPGPQPGEVRDLQVTRTNPYGDIFVGLYMSAEDINYLKSATKVVVNGSYTGDNWDNKGFELVGTEYVNVRLALGAPLTEAEYLLEWYNGETLIARYTYVHTATTPDPDTDPKPDPDPQPQPGEGKVYDVYNPFWDPNILSVWFRTEGYEKEDMFAVELWINGEKVDAAPYEIITNGVAGQYKVNFNNIYNYLKDGVNTIEFKFAGQTYSPTAGLAGGPHKANGKQYTFTTHEGKLAITVENA